MSEDYSPEDLAAARKLWRFVVGKDGLPELRTPRPEEVAKALARARSNARAELMRALAVGPVEVNARR